MQCTAVLAGLSQAYGLYGFRDRSVTRKHSPDFLKVARKVKCMLMCGCSIRASRDL